MTDALDTLKIKAKTKKPIIISMGEGGNKSLIKKNFSKNKTTFCYCISEYPTPINKINWKEAMKYDGFSDHTLGNHSSNNFFYIKKTK